MSLPDDGVPFTIDARIFSRSGVEGTHHVERDIEMFCEPAGHNPRESEGERTLLLTQDQRRALYAPYVWLLDGMVVPADGPTTHPQVKEVHVE